MRLSTRTTPHVTSAIHVARITGVVEPIFTGDFWNIPGYDQLELALRVKGILVKGQRVDPRPKKWGDA